MSDAKAHSVSAVRSHGLQPVVWLLLFLPALRLFPGHTPAQEPSCLLVGNCSIFGPVSARIDAALRSWIPGTVWSSSHSRSIPDSLICAAITLSSSVICSSRNFKCWRL